MFLLLECGYQQINEEWFQVFSCSLARDELFEEVITELMFFQTDFVSLKRDSKSIIRIGNKMRFIIKYIIILILKSSINLTLMFFKLIPYLIFIFKLLNAF